MRNIAPIPKKNAAWRRNLEAAFPESTRNISSMRKWMLAKPPLDTEIWTPRFPNQRERFPQFVDEHAQSDRLTLHFPRLSQRGMFPQVVDEYAQSLAQQIQIEGREIRTPNLLIWSQTRCRCAIPPLQGSSGINVSTVHHHR